MKDRPLESEDPKLHALLQKCRPARPLPPGFQNAVWRRIENAEPPERAGSWLERLAMSLLRPRWALASLTAVLLLGGVFGVVQGIDLSKQVLRQQYLSSVSPMTVHP